jgi:MFS family permease
MNQKITKSGLCAVGVGLLYYCYEYLLRISPSVMQDDLMQHFNINASLFGAFSAFYYYASTPMQLVVGVVVDKYQIRKVLLIAVLLNALGIFIIAAFDNYNIAKFGRFIEGFASAFAWVSILKLSVLFLPIRWLGFATGIGSVFGFLGAAIGQIAMGFVVQHFGWKIVLQFLAIMGIPLAILVYRVIKSAELRLINNQTYQSTPPIPDKTSDIDFKGWLVRFLIVARKPQIWQAGIIATLLFLPTAVFAELWGVRYMSTIYGFSNTEASSVTAMIFIGWAIGAIVMGILSIICKARIKIIQIGAVFALVVSIILLYVKLPYMWLCLSCMLLGVFSAVQILTFPMGMEVVSSRLAGIAAAFVNFLCMSSGMIFQRVAGQILDWSWDGKITSSGARIYTENNYKIAICIVPISLLTCVIFTMLLKDRKKRINVVRIN